MENQLHVRWLATSIAVLKVPHSWPVDCSTFCTYRKGLVLNLVKLLPEQTSHSKLSNLERSHRVPRASCLESFMLSLLYLQGYQQSTFHLLAQQSRPNVISITVLIAYPGTLPFHRLPVLSRRPKKRKRASYQARRPATVCLQPLSMFSMPCRS